MAPRSQNEITRFGMEMAEKAGVSDIAESKLLANISGVTKSAGGLMREAFVKGVLDRVMQEKVRKMMKWVIHAQFTPAFDLPRTQGDNGVDEHSEAFDLTAIRPDGDRIPRRMFNIDTGNLEDWPSGQYCILSHSWKGSEIVFPDLQAVKAGAREKELYERIIRDDPDEGTRRIAEFIGAKHAHLDPRYNDVELLRIQCLKDLDECGKKIAQAIGAEPIPENVIDEAHLTTNELYAEALKFRKDSVLIFLRHCARYEKSIAAVRPHVLPYLRLLISFKNGERPSADGAPDWNAIKAEDPDLSAAVEELLPCLEKLRSIQKIERSLHETKRIFGTGLFDPMPGKRYLWNDTICINKQDANELNDSLAMMGEWYGNAELCLVHIDTPISEWISTYENLDRPRATSSDQDVSATPNKFGHGLYENFEDLHIANPRPKWATRGWTLQELVLPKVVFYVNSLWKPLPRSVTVLGPYYYLCGFLQQHVQIDDTKYALASQRLRDTEFLKDIAREVKAIPEYATIAIQDGSVMSDLESEGSGNYTTWTEKIRHHINLLRMFDIDFPRNMNEDTASVLVDQTIYQASQNYVAQSIASPAKAIQANRLLQALGIASSEDQTRSLATEQVTLLVKLIIRALVYEAMSEIEADRKRAARFGAVPYEECCRGFRRSMNPAQTMLLLAAFRECTVSTDRVYSLMGVLDVQFTVFHAEGMTQALSRLLDEVIVSTNDVSVFNWSGKDMGSPKRGRSLYPSTLAAYDPNRDDKADVARKVMSITKLKAFQDKKLELQQTSRNLSMILKGFADYVKSQDQDRVHIPAVRNLLRIVRDTKLDSLTTQVPTMGKVLSFFKLSNQNEGLNLAKTGNSQAVTSPMTTPVSTGTSAPASPSVEELPGSGKKGGRFGIKAPKMPSVPKIPNIPTNINLGLHNANSPANMGKQTTRPTPVTRPSEQDVQIEKVEKWLLSTSNFEKESVTHTVQQILEDLEPPPTVGLPRQYGQAIAKSHREQAISPNPIILTTSGIEGFFDIQRVIVEMKDPQKLRQKLSQAIDPSQKINGRCRIGTAVASLEVDFRCTANQLQTQMNVCDVTRFAIWGDARLEEPDDTAAPTEDKEAVTIDGARGRSNDPKPMAKSEEQLVERMLDFVEESNLSMVAGEWVLVKFSGAPAAKWFLCLFELGASNSWYGRRIPTDEIDFATADPERILVNDWHRYMKEKKNAMCNLIERLVQGKYAQKMIAGQGETLLTEYGGGEDDDIAGTLSNLITTGTSFLTDAAGAVYEAEANMLDAGLNDAALKNTPKKVRTAIMAMNDNEDLLPAMFVSDVRIHMF